MPALAPSSDRKTEVQTESAGWFAMFHPPYHGSVSVWPPCLPVGRWGSDLRLISPVTGRHRGAGAPSNQQPVLSTTCASHRHITLNLKNLSSPPSVSTRLDRLIFVNFMFLSATLSLSPPPPPPPPNSSSLSPPGGGG